MTGSSRESGQNAEPDNVDPDIIDAEIVSSGDVVPAPPPPAAPAPDYDQRGNPSFDYVRAKIEGRAATALGGTELAGDLPEARTLDEQMAERDKKAADKLAEMRKQLGL